MDPPQAENISRIAELTLDTNTTALKLEPFVSRFKLADAFRATTYVARHKL
jgi:hypothetical protein